MRFPKNKAHVFLARRQNADRWITVKPNGPDAKGRPALIDGEGTVKGGMGGKFNGDNIKDARKDEKRNPQKTREDIGKKETRAPRDFSNKSYSERWTDSEKAKASGISRFTPHLEGKSRDAVSRYAGDLYDPINQTLREDMLDSDAELKPIVREIDKAIDSADPLPTSTIMQRGVSPAFMKELSKMDEFVDKGFCSTTLSSKVSLGFASSDNANVMEIMIPKGSKGLFIPAALDPPGGENDEEAEFLLPRNAKFKVNKLPNGKIMLEYQGSAA